MEQHEIERLMNDIQDYLSRDSGSHEDDCGEEEEPTDELDDGGSFISDESRIRMERHLRCLQIALYSTEALTISLFTAVMLFPFQNWLKTIIFLAGVLLFGIFSMSVLLGLQTRIRLLFQIEINTRQIALSKGRIAEVLERIVIE